MKKTLVFVIMVSLVSLFSSCHQNKAGQQPSFQSVDVATFKEALKDTSLLLLDVRTAQEHEEGCIPGTDFNIDVLEAGFTEKAEQQLGNVKQVAIYCRSGNRSKKAADLLLKAGYDVIELASGYKGWSAAQ